MQPQTFAFANSPFWPIAIGFFGLGTGYFGGLSKAYVAQLEFSHHIPSPSATDTSN